MVSSVPSRKTGRNYARDCCSSLHFRHARVRRVFPGFLSVTKRYGPAPLAFIVLPLVSAFFVDLANAVIIQIFVGL